VLLIACANLANLISAQAAARAREMALRASIGAEPVHLVRLVLAECAMLAIAAAALGAVMAWPAAPFVVARINPPENPARLSLAADWRVLGFGLALTFAVTLLFGLPPALRASSISPVSALRDGDARRFRSRRMRVLIAVQASFCSLVLFVSGLFVATFDRLAHQDLGFSVDGLLALDTVTPRDEPPQAWSQVAEHLRSVPGVESAAVSEWALLDGNGYRYNGISIDGGPPSEVAVRFLLVSPRWIETMKIPLIEGRDLRPGETGAAIVNREFAREYFPATDPIGKWFEATPGGEWGRRFQIVGVAGDTRYRTVRDPIMPVAFIPYTAPWHVETFMVRVLPSQTNSPALASLLRDGVARARPGFRVTAIRTQQALLQAQTVRERLIALLGSFFAAVALLLAGVGLYGALDYSIFRQRREMAIRMAIGAQPREIARRLTLETFFMLLAGAFAGLAMGLASARYLGTLLYQVSPTGPAAIAFPSAALLAMALLASAAPLVRAARTDPAVLLRAE
jgi:putative ABC transport system permease protein